MSQPNQDHLDYLDGLTADFQAFKDALKDALRVQDNPGSYKFDEAEVICAAYIAVQGALQSRLGNGPRIGNGYPSLIFGSKGPALPVLVGF